MSDHEAPRPDRIIGVKQGQVPWAREIINILRETASTYNATITYADLAEEVQRRTGLRTNVQQRNWIGGVLAIVVMACHERDLPPLTSLVVRKQDGRVGSGYDEVLRMAGLSPIDDELEREQHAAASRLECYREYCDDVPEDAEPTLVTRTASTSARSRASAGSASRATATRRTPPREEAPAVICQTCFIQLPVAGGACPNCD